MLFPPAFPLPMSVATGRPAGAWRRGMIQQTLSAALATAFIAAPAHADTAVLAGGCFWGIETVFEHVNGVTDVVSGFAGGSRSDANYDAVSSERTGHAEAVRITYDPK